MPKIQVAALNALLDELEKECKAIITASNDYDPPFAFTFADRREAFPVVESWLGGLEVSIEDAELDWLRTVEWRVKGSGHERRQSAPEVPVLPADAVIDEALTRLYDLCRGPSNGDDLDTYLDSERDDPSFVEAYIKAHIERAQEDTDALKRLGYLGPDAKPLPWDEAATRIEAIAAPLIPYLGPAVAAEDPQAVAVTDGTAVLAVEWLYDHAKAGQSATPRAAAASRHRRTVLAALGQRPALSEDPRIEALMKWVDDQEFYNDNFRSVPVSSVVRELRAILTASPAGSALDQDTVSGNPSNG